MFSTRSRYPRTTVVAVLAVLTVVGVPGGVLAGPSGEVDETSLVGVHPSTVARAKAERPLILAGNLIKLAAEPAPGYAGIGADGGRVTVWWQGTPPAAVQAAIKQARRTVPVRVAAAKHSRAELKAASNKVLAYLRSHPDGPYFGVSIATDGSRVTVYAEPASGRLAATAVPAEMAVPAGTTVSVVEQPRARSAAGRLSDTPPFYGGGRINYNRNESMCTAGFAVRRADVAYMLTAGHCGKPSFTFNNGDDSQFFGTAALENTEHDVLIVQASVSRQVFVNPAGVPESTWPVVGAHDDVFMGVEVCSSGSVTLSRCDYQVSFDREFSFCDTDADGEWVCLTDLIIAYHQHGAPGPVGGDSGGPVFIPSGNNVLAVGTITGFIGSNGLIFQNWGTARNDLGLRLF